MKRDITFLALGGGSLLLSFFAPAALPVNPAWLAILLCGAPIVREAAVGLFTRFDIKADVLVSLALLASVAIGEIFAAGEIAFIMQLGSLLEERTVAKARAGIEKLVRLTPRTARRVTAAGGESIGGSRPWRWGTGCGCSPERPFRWTGWCGPDRPPSTRR